MKNYKSVILVLFVSFSLIAAQSFAQKNKRGGDQQSGKSQKKELKDLRGNYVLLKAIEKSDKWDITIDYGIDKEIYSNDKEKEAFDEVLETGSLIDLINILNYKGMEISSAYPITSGKTTTHYIWLMRTTKVGGKKGGKNAKGGKSNMSKEEMQKRRQEMQNRE